MARIAVLYFDLKIGSFLPGLNHGLAYLVGTLRQDGNKVSLYHLLDKNDFKTTIDSLSALNPDIIGLSFCTNQKAYTRQFLEMFSSEGRLKSRLIIAGGVHVSLIKEEAFNDFPEINAICIGEGEGPLRELCWRLDNGRDILVTPSFYFKTPRGIVKNYISPLQDIETYPYPDYSLFDYKRIVRENGNWYPMMLSRGCPFDCNYCLNHVLKHMYPNKSKYVRFPPAFYAVGIVKNNLSLLPNTKKIQFDDDIFILNKSWLLDFCKLYKGEIGLPFACNARVEIIDEEIAQSLKYAGCRFINMGVETGNEWLRKNILNRHHSNEEIKRVFSILKKYKIRTFSYNMIGLPFEDSNMAQDTLNLNEDIEPDLGTCSYFYPYQGTALYKLCVENQLLLGDIESKSSFYEGPSIRETFMTWKEMKSHAENIQIYFYSRLFLSRLRLPFFIERIILKIIFVFKKPVLRFLSPNLNRPTLMLVRRKIRAFAMKYLR
jgi:radical SAM superfamily enzyme YgiQ (UPF0313 family)